MKIIISVNSKYCWIADNIHKHFFFFLTSCFLLIISCLFYSCNSTKKLTDGEYLLHKNIITDKTSHIDKDDISVYIKQKPNRKMLFWKFYLHLYNSVNKEKMERKKMERNTKIDSINAKRIIKNDKKNIELQAKGEKPKKVVLKTKDNLTYREWLLNIGEAPVIYDSMLAKKSAKQIKMFFNNKGFFNSTVKDSVRIKNKRANVYYSIKNGTSYKFRNVSYEIKDDQLNYYVLSDALASLIKRDQNYDIDILQSERDRITDMLRNEGYFYFAKDYIYFEADSAMGEKQIDITIDIKNPIVKVSGEKDSIAEIAHTRYYLGKIYIQINHDDRIKKTPTDTIVVNDYYITSTGHLQYKSNLITNAIFFNTGGLFQQKNVELTYKRLSELKMFRTIQIQFSENENKQLNCFIYLSPISKQAFLTETEGTNTSGTLGIAGNLLYQNKNLFKGGEIMEVKLKGAMEVQKTSEPYSPQIIDVNIPFFNTIELGEEATLYIPRFVVPFFLVHTQKSNNAKTNFTSIYNYQKRPDFGRSIANVSYGYSWNETSTKKHIINPIEFNLVNIFKLSNKLQNTIDNSKDIFLKNSYSDHFTLGTRYTFIYNNQEIHKRKNFSYLKIGAEGSGNFLRGMFNLIDRYVSDVKLYEGGYMIDSIRFSQYLRFDFDYRYYKIVNESDRLVYRIAFGVGKPLHNLRVLPLEKSFFVGGPNSVRAWSARTLGPGAYNDTTNSAFADKIGDVKFEGNIEYRFNVIRMLNAAIFLDAGNIWLRKLYKDYPGGEILLEKILGQIAFGTGIGFRFDFDFFIIRLDGAIRIKDPSLPEGNRMTYDKQPFKKFVLNFGIGYPF
ncbi:MAG: BamA/TamA family outer membrane protein [Bacteroidota bacterium]